MRAAKSAAGNEWNWATGYAKLHSPYGQQLVFTAAVKYVVTPAQNWIPDKEEFRVYTYANGDGTGFDAISGPYAFTTNFSSEHTTTAITPGEGAKFFRVKDNKCTFKSGMNTDVVNLEDSGFVQFRD